MEQIKIDIVPVGVAPVAHASQFDNSRQIRFNLFNQGTPYTLTGAETVTMVVNGEEENITNTSDNYVIWDVAEEDCAEAGVIGCEIRIVLGSMLIGSKNFFLEVEMDPYNGKNIRTITVGPADICTFETTLLEPLQSVIVDVEATGGNGTPDNPNPINGYTGANITRCGVNLWDEVWEVGSYDASGQPVADNTILRSKNYITIPKNTTVYITAPWNGVFYWYDANKAFISYTGFNANGDTKTAPVNACYLHFRMASNYGTTYNNDISINYPSTDSAYHPYNGDTVTISFGQTVYGGVLDVTRGKLKPCIEYPSYNGETLSGRWLSSEATYVEGTTPPTGSQVVSLDDYGTDIDLTPEVISAIVGTNNVFADCGQTEVKYLAEG